MQGVEIVKEGARDEYYYIIESGSLALSLKGKVVGELKDRGSFGLYSLMANCAHEHTVTTISSCKPESLFHQLTTTSSWCLAFKLSPLVGNLWRLKRSIFQFILVRKKEARMSRVRSFINTCPLLSTLPVDLREQIASAVKHTTYEPGNASTVPVGWTWSPCGLILSPSLCIPHRVYYHQATWTM